MGTDHKISMSGATGFVGSTLGAALQKREWDIVPLGREDVTSGNLSEKMQGSDVVINLAGAPVINKWSEEYKKIMYESRIRVTEKIVYACSEMHQKPKLFISTSAVGYYATGGTHTEDKNRKADGFLGDLAQDWEQEALKAADLGIRTIIFRFGVVLGRDGGALKQMLTPFRLGMGGMIGDGSQAFSWIHMKDLIRAYETVIDDTAYEGIYNLSSPGPTTNKGLTGAIGRALHRPTLLKIPQFILRAQLGEGTQVLTGGQHVIPKRLLDSGFTFLYKDIEDAVRDCIA